MIRIAKIINTRGLKGECKMMLYTDQPEERFVRGEHLFLDEKKELIVERFSMYKGFGYACFEGINTIEDAEKLKNHILYLPEDELGETDEDEYYYHQLTGCHVYNQHGEDTGTVTDILETGANLVLRIQGENGSYLLPFVSAHVLEVDPEKKEIRIEEMEGLR